MQYYQYMYTLPTQRALSVILSPFGISYSSLVAPLHHQDAWTLLTGRYADLADLQTSCWSLAEGQAACSGCNNCFGTAVAHLSAGLDPARLGIDVGHLFVHEGDWSFPSDGWDTRLPTTRADLEMDAGVYEALERLPLSRVVAAAHGATLRQRLQVAVGVRSRRSRGREAGGRPPKGFVASFLPYTDLALEPALSRIFASELRADPEDDGSAGRGDALLRWITEPLREARP